VLRGSIPPDFESLLQAGHAVLCDLLQFFQQRRENFVQHRELEQEEEEGSVAAEPGGTRPGQAVAANNAGRSTRSGCTHTALLLQTPCLHGSRDSLASPAHTLLAVNYCIINQWLHFHSCLFPGLTFHLSFDVLHPTSSHLPA
jgi:hypothetical protein